MKARRTASFGAAYNYSQMSYPSVPMHPSLTPLVELVGRTLAFRPNNCLLNYYPDGTSSMGFHTDRLSELAEGTGVAVVSLGAARTLHHCHVEDRSRRHALALRPGSLLYMAPAILMEWQHALPPEPGAGARISLSFRNSR